MRRATEHTGPAGTGWGGRRVNAGRKRRGVRPSTPHRARPFHRARHPVHVTLRCHLRTLRTQALFRIVSNALGASTRADFRVVHFSLQSSHLHALVEASHRLALSRGMRGLAIRIARRINSALGRRGTLWADRWYGRTLTSTRAVRRCLMYVLQNFKKHHPGILGADARSSALWFDGWRDWRPIATGPPPVAAARTWLLRFGWRRHGLISLSERPRS